MTDHEAKMVEDQLDRLGVHFDTVQIIVTKHDEKTRRTESYVAGVGNYFARMESARQWLLREDAMTAENAVEQWQERNENQDEQEDDA